MAFTYRKTVKTLNDSMELIAKSLKSRLEENFSDASGELGNSIAVSAKKSSNLLEVNISMLEYWEALDKGRKPGKQPPINKIKEWLTYPNPRAKMGIEDLSSTDIAKTTSLAFLIARNIGKNGTKGNNFASDVFDSKKVTTDLPNAIADAVFEDLNTVLDDLVTSIN